jgi:hypothetical protein
MVERECWIEDRQTVERRVFINSIPADAKHFADAVRGHWGIENRLHWRLDIVFDEDASRIRKDNAPAILTSIRHLCMNLFEQEPSKLRLAQTRRKTAWNDDYRANVHGRSASHPRKIKVSRATVKQTAPFSACVQMKATCGTASRGLS